MRTLLQQYYDMLVWKGHPRRQFDGELTGAELADWWVVSDSVRDDMAAYFTHTSKSSSSSSTSSPSAQLRYEVGYGPFFYSLFRASHTRRTKQMTNFFHCLAYYTSLLTSSYFRIQQSPSLSALGMGHLTLGVIALKTIDPQDSNCKRAGQAIQGDLVRITVDEYEALREVGADHSVLEATYGDRAGLEEAKKRKADAEPDPRSFLLTGPVTHETATHMGLDSLSWPKPRYRGFWPRYRGLVQKEALV